MSGMRELLEKCGLFVSCASDFTREQRLDLLNEIKAELAKPEPEPFCYLNAHYYDGSVWVEQCEHDEENAFPVYTNPPAQQKPLSDEEIEKELRYISPSAYSLTWENRDIEAYDLAIARAIEDAHGIK